MPSVDAAIAASYLALREECAPAGLRIYDAAEARAHFGEVSLGANEALLLAATAGPTDLAACDRDLVTSAVVAEGGLPADARLAEAWWKLRGGLPSHEVVPTLQVTATPGTMRAVYHAVRAAAGPDARAHIARFDADGAVLFFTLPAEATAAAEEAARAAGGWLLGSRAKPFDPYLASLRQALDPKGIMNPGALT
jgi:hypothetical protein